jgi:hypothetical protein
MLLKQPTILLTFDVEEFDLPLEYKEPITLSRQMEIGKTGLDVITDVLNEHAISCTLFTTGSFAKTYPAAAKDLSANCEIASHSLFHSTFKTADLLESKLLLQEITGKQVVGFRMPRMQPVNISDLKNAGYTYDASINPTVLPGRYNNLHLSRTFYSENSLLRLPGSVTPNLRIPLFWLSFKNFPYKFYCKLAMQTLHRDGYLSLYFHPWEFTDISSFKLPFYIKKLSGIALTERLHMLIEDLKKEAIFSTVKDYITQHVSAE